MKVLYHLGLGDAIACAAIIAKLAQENDVVEIPCWEHNLDSVKSFYINHPNVIVKPFKIESDVLEWAKDANLRLGYYTEKYFYNEDFVQCFYRQSRLNIKYKYKHCPINEAAKSADKMHASVGLFKLHTNPFSVFHEDAERGFIINKSVTDKAIFNIQKSYSGKESEFGIIGNYHILMDATEIHCIDSSVLHLVECLPTKAKLFYHKYARPNSTDYKYLQKIGR